MGRRKSEEALEYWRWHVAQYESSGQTRATYSATQGIKVHTLDYWRLKLKKASLTKPSGENWIPVKILEEAISIDLNVGKIRITVRPGFNHDLLREVLQVVSL
jgi:hypothetical protein